MMKHTNLQWSAGSGACPSQALFYALRRAILAHRGPTGPGRLHPRTRLRDCLPAEQANLIQPLLRQRLGAEELPVQDRVLGLPALELGATWLALWFPCFLYWLIVCGDPGIPRFWVMPGFVLPPLAVAVLVGGLSRPAWIGVRTLGDLTRWLLRRSEQVAERGWLTGSDHAGGAVPDRAEVGREQMAVTPIQPLHCPELDQMEAGTPWVEKALMWVPILGWTVSAILWWERAIPLVESIEEQLQARPEPDPALWGEAPRRAEIGRYVCTVARDEMGWLNDRFIPDDRFDIVFWSHQDGLDAAVAVLEIEEHLDLEVPDSDVDRWFKEKVTLGEVVDDLLALLARQAGGDPLD